jgi:hypothetical protein
MIEANILNGISHILMGIGFVINHPKDFLKIVIRTYIPWNVGTPGLTGQALVTTFFGSNLGWFSVPLSKTVIFIWMILTGIAGVLRRENAELLSTDKKLVCAFIIFGIVFALCLGMFISWTPYNQSRYRWIAGKIFYSYSISYCLAFSK